MNPLAEVGLRLAAIVAALAGGRWLLRAICVPNRLCRACKGSGNNPMSGDGLQGDCWFCGGKRKQMRWSARVVRGQIRGKRWGR